MQNQVCTKPNCGSFLGDFIENLIEPALKPSSKLVEHTVTDVFQKRNILSCLVCL